MSAPYMRWPLPFRGFMKTSSIPSAVNQEYCWKMSPSQFPQQIGSHAVSVDEDVMVVRYQGEYLAEDARQILTLADQIYSAHGRVFLLADVTHTNMAGPETRRIVATWNYLGNYHSVVFGASLAIRTIIQLMMAAQRTLGSGPPFVATVKATEAEARAWVEEERRKLTAK